LLGQNSVFSCYEYLRKDKLYLLKIRGAGKISDYLQVRDDYFTLIAYFKVDSYIINLNKIGLENYIKDFENIVVEMPFGEMKYIKNK